MRRLILAITLIFAVATTASAQKYIVVDSEKIFRSQADYTKALSTLDALAKEYQTKVDGKFAEVESLYNAYMAQKSSLSTAARNEREQAILNREKAAAEYQESVFGNDGVMMKKRIELIQPIQNRIFTAIEKYAESIGCDLVLDKASNPSLLYNSKAVDHTQTIIESLK